MRTIHVRSIDLFRTCLGYIWDFIEDARRLCRIAVVRTAFVVTKNVFRARNRLFPFIFFPITFNVRVSILRTIVLAPVNNCQIVNNKIIRLRTFSVRIATIGYSIGYALSEYRVIAARNAMYGIRRFANTTIIHVTKVKMVSFCNGSVSQSYVVASLCFISNDRNCYATSFLHHVIQVG